jgi:large subunit ribosomal protein L32
MKAVNFSSCPQCGKSKTPHRVCPHCGYYKGKPVITVMSVKEKKKERKPK